MFFFVKEKPKSFGAGVVTKGLGALPQQHASSNKSDSRSSQDCQRPNVLRVPKERRQRRSQHKKEPGSKNGMSTRQSLVPKAAQTLRKIMAEKRPLELTRYWRSFRNQFQQSTKIWKP